jgi:hypothetical protein
MLAGQAFGQISPHERAVARLDDFEGVLNEEIRDASRFGGAREQKLLVVFKHVECPCGLVVTVLGPHVDDRHRVFSRARDEVVALLCQLLLYRSKRLVGEIRVLHVDDQKRRLCVIRKHVLGSGHVAVRAHRVRASCIEVAVVGGESFAEDRVV